MISVNQLRHDRTVDLTREFWQLCRPVRLRPLAAWAEQELRLPSGPAEGRRYRTDRLPYAKLLLNELGKWRRHVITGPVQSGKSLHAFAMIILYYLFEVKEDVIVGLPDLGMAGQKWVKDIRPLINSSSYAHLMPKKGAGSHGGQPVLVEFGHGRTLQFMGGGGNDKQRASATAKILIITETDALGDVSESSKEGQTKLDQLEGRIKSHGLDALQFMECTVTKTSGITWREYCAGTQSRIACPCPHCAAYVTPERNDLYGWDQAESKLEAGEKAFFACPGCGQKLSEQDRRAMNLNAVLVHKGQEITPGGQIVGDAPKTDTLGFRWSAFNNLLVPVSMLGMAEWAAAHSEDPTGAEIAIKQQLWATPADDKRVERTPLSIGIVRGSTSGYHGRCNGRAEWEVPEWSTAITAHVDVGMRVLNWSVNAHGPGNIRDVIAYGATATEQPDVIGPEEAVLAGLHRVREIIEQNCELSVGLVDCGWQGNKKEKNPRRVVYEFIMSCRGVWHASMGLSAWRQKDESDDFEPSLTGAPWYFSRQDYLDDEIWVVDFEPNHFKHLSHGSYLIQPFDKDGNRQRGSVTIFGSDPKQHNEFATQLNGERWELDHKTQRSVFKKHGRNHYGDTDVGNLVGMSVVESLRKARDGARSPQTPSVQVITAPDGRAFFVGNRDV